MELLHAIMLIINAWLCSHTVIKSHSINLMPIYNINDTQILAIIPNDCTIREYQCLRKNLYAIKVSREVFRFNLRFI